MCEALDILRMMLLHPQCATYFAKDAGDGKDVVMESLRRATSEPMLAANLVTGARVAVNCFKHHALHTWTMDHRSEVIFSFFYWLLHMFTSYLWSLTPIHCLAKRDK
jgi:phospholipase A-2-activating protein